MKNNAFEDHIIKLLQEMSVQQKDDWILIKAKLISETEQQDFIMSLTGEKKITYMPTETEIEEFCRKVNCGDIYVEYESHYCEFNSEGKYINDWEIWHNDPKEAFPFFEAQAPAPRSPRAFPWHRKALQRYPRTLQKAPRPLQ